LAADQGRQASKRPAIGRYRLPSMSSTVKNMDRWLGDGGMPIIELCGGSFTGYGVDGEDLGWATGAFTPTDLACNPHGIVQAGIHSLLLDASMNFAINAALPGKARTRGTLEMKTECMRPALRAEPYTLRGEVVRMAKQIAYGEASMRDADGELISRATGTFLLHRPSPEPDSPG
jgi:acyl-coenzyme A thioesterase PaaI-like protein